MGFTTLAWALLTIAAGPQVGDFAPPVALQDQHGQWRDIAEQYGRRYVALTFYPKDNTSGCTLEALSLTQHLEELTEARLAVYGVSVQGLTDKQAFCAQHSLKHTLLSDPDKTVCGAYGTLNDRGLSNRVTFLLDPSLRLRVIDTKVNVRTHATDLLKMVETLRTEDAKSGLGTPADEATETGLGLKLHLPSGWRQASLMAGSAAWIDPAYDQVTMRLTSGPAEGALTNPQALREHPPVGIRPTHVDHVDLAGRPAVRLEGVPTGPVERSVSMLIWHVDGTQYKLQIHTVPERAGDASRLLAAVAGAG